MNIPTYLSALVYTQAYRTLRAHVATTLELYKLTPTSWSLLGIVLESTDGVRLNQVAARLTVKAPLITTLSHEFIERGLIRRVAHPVDGRAKLLVITPEGKTFCRKVEEDLSTVLARLLKGISEEDLKIYKKVLDAIVANGMETPK